MHIADVWTGPLTTEKRPWEALPRPWVLDIGSGGAPFPFANILLDLYPGEGYPHRNVPLRVGPGQILVQGDAHHLPFEDGEIDFVWVMDLLEHVDDPKQVISEMVRVSPMGIIGMPTVALEAIIQVIRDGEKSNGHKWLCRSEGPGLLGFLRCDDSKKDEVRGLLATLGWWPRVPTSLYNANIFHCWGWGGWNETIEGKLYEPTEESVRSWGAVYAFGGEI